jgi:uncharacterized membrane protein
MKAEEARKLTNDASKVDTSKIYEKIEKAARNGDDNICVDVSSWKSKNFVVSFVDELRTNGYRATRNQGYDQRDGESWDQINICW